MLCRGSVRENYGPKGQVDEAQVEEPRGMRFEFLNLHALIDRKLHESDGEGWGQDPPSALDF